MVQIRPKQGVICFIQKFVYMNLIGTNEKYDSTEGDLNTGRLDALPISPQSL